MFVDTFLDLIKAGVLKREVDGVLLHAAFFVGPKAFYRALREMDEAQLSRLQMKAISFVNELYGDEEMQTPRARQGSFHQQRHDGNPARRVVSDALETVASSAESAANTTS